MSNGSHAHEETDQKNNLVGVHPWMESNTSQNPRVIQGTAVVDMGTISAVEQQERRTA